MAKTHGSPRGRPRKVVEMSTAEAEQPNIQEFNDLSATAQQPSAQDDPEVPVSQATKRYTSGKTFFQRVAEVPPLDWGTRVFLYLYCWEPIHDAKRSGERKYFMRYEKPVFDEDTVMHDAGSGKFEFKLANRKQTEHEKNPALASYEFEIYNPKFPPKIPRSQWMDDPRNKKWADLMPPEEPKVNGSQQTSPVEMFNTFMDMQDRVEDRAKERTDANRPQTWDPAQQLATVVTAAKDIAGALKATPENPIPAFISEQMTAMRAELTAQRARSDALMDRLLDNAKAPQQQNGAMSGIKELVSGIKELLPDIQGLFPKVDDAIAGRMGHSRMGGWQEFFQPVLPGLVQALAPLVPVIASRVASTGTPQPPSFTGSPRLPNMPPQQPSLPSAAPEPNLDAMLLNALGNERTGGDFADSILTLFGPLLYRQICSLGEAGMLAMLQQRPVWGQLGALQAKMPDFIHDFVTYGEEGGQDEESAAPDANAEQPPIDLTAEVDVGGMA